MIDRYCFVRLVSDHATPDGRATALEQTAIGQRAGTVGVKVPGPLAGR